MFWKILQWVQVVVSLIREAEDALGFGRGDDKRAFVVGEAVEHLEQLATRAQVGRCDRGVYASYAGQIVDGAVGLMNCFGALPKTTATRSSTSPAEVPGSPPPAPAPGE